MLTSFSAFCRFSMLKQLTKFVNYEVGTPDKMSLSERTIEPQEGELLIKVKAVGINRAQTLHRQGKYKINNPKESFLGLQACGQVYDPKTNQKLFDGMALLSGGSYSQWASVSAKHVMPLPKNLSYLEGGAIPEAWLTAFQLLRLAKVKTGQNIVIYAGASGVGTAAIQLGQLLGAQVWAVVSTAEKGKVCLDLGAKGVVYYRQNQDWVQQLIKQRGGLFDAVLDCVGPQNCPATIELLTVDGHWILFGLLSGAKVELNLGLLLFKRINMISTTLKTRSSEYKDNLIEDFRATAWKGFEEGRLKPIIFKVLGCDWSSASPFIEAHTLMQSNANVGKIMIEYK